MYIFKKYKNNIYYFKLGNIQEHEFNNYINDFTLIFKKKEHFKVIFDLSEIIIKDSFYSKQIIIFMNNNKENTTTYLDKSVIIIYNNFFKNLINNLILFIYKPIKPNIIVNKLIDAFDYINN